MTDTNEPVRTFEKKLPSLGEDAPPVRFTELANGEYIVDFAEEAHREPIRDLAQRAGHDPAIADLPFVWGEPVSLSDTSAGADLAIQPGDIVQRGSDSATGTVVFGLVVEVNDTDQQVKVEPLQLEPDGSLTRTGERPVMWDLSAVQASDKTLSEPQAWPQTTKQVGPSDTSPASMSDDGQLYRAWAESSGVGDDEDGADLASSGEEFALSDARQEQDALHEELRRLSDDRDSGPDPATDERSRGLLSIWRKFFYNEQED